jgi:hypothetical protein
MPDGTITTGEGQSKQDWKITIRELRDSGSPTAIPNAEGTEEEWVVYSREYDSKFPSGQYGYIDIRGPKKPGTLRVGGHVKGGALRKFGFREYTPSGGKPRYYLQESASGGFPGCAERNADPKTYSGNQRYDIGGQWGPRYFQNFSGDVWESGYYSHSGFPNWKRWAGEGKSPFPDTESPTMREWVEGSDCNNSRIEDRIRFQLSDELTLPRMKQLVEANFSRPAESQRWPQPWNFEGAANFTSEDEELYIHQKYYHYFLLNITNGYPFSQNERLTLSFKYRILRINLNTGRVTESTRSVSATFGQYGRGIGNDYIRIPEKTDQFLELTAQSGEMAVIRPAPANDQPKRDLLCNYSPLAFFKNEPRKMRLSRTIPIEPQWRDSDEFEDKRSD